MRTKYKTKTVTQTETETETAEFPTVTASTSWAIISPTRTSKPFLFFVFFWPRDNCLHGVSDTGVSVKFRGGGGIWQQRSDTYQVNFQMMMIHSGLVLTNSSHQFQVQL